MDEALRRGCEAPEGYVRALATDADGTLWQGDVADKLFLTLAEANDLRPGALSVLRHQAEELLGELPSGQGELARAVLAAYARGAIRIDSLCALEAIALGDRTVTELKDCLAAIAERMVAAVRPEARAFLHGARALGFGIHVVSGSLGAAVEAALEAAGLPYDSVTGATLTMAEGYVHPTLAGDIPLHEGKVRALEAANAWPTAVGMGDGGWDASFLRGVYVPVLMYPAPALVAAMGAHPRVVRVPYGGG